MNKKKIVIIILVLIILICFFTIYILKNKKEKLIFTEKSQNIVELKTEIDESDGWNKTIYYIEMNGKK